MAFFDEANGKPTQQKFLDLLPLKPYSKEEVHNALRKLTELKLRPEKIPDEEDVVKPLSWKFSKKSPYLDPVPLSMLHVNIRQLSLVDIDWKMLTFDRPEAQVEIQIFSRMIYLDKLMLKCVMEEKEKKAREKYVRLRTKGRPKPPADSDVDAPDEFNYEYFSRFSSFGGRQQDTVGALKKKANEDLKTRPNPASEAVRQNRTPVPPPTRPLKKKKTPARNKLKKKRKKKKKNKKGKLRKRKLATGTKPKASRKAKPTQLKRRKRTWNGKTASNSKQRKQVVANKTTLVQMLRSKELKEKRSAAARKSEVVPKNDSQLKGLD